MKLKLVYLLFAISILSSTVAYATNNGNKADIKNNKQFNNENEFKKPENEVIGKITSISENSITVTIAERKQFDFKKNDQAPEKKKDNNSTDNSKRPEINLDEMFTLTNETKTYDISSAKLIAGRDFNNKKDNNTDNNSKQQKPTEVESKYTDFKTGDYVMIELESSTSTKAKSVRKETGRFGSRFGGDFGGMKPKDSNDGKRR